MKSQVSISLTYLLTILLVLTSAIHSQDNPAEVKRPEAVATRALIALKENRIQDFGREMHPESLKQLRSTLPVKVDTARRSRLGGEKGTRRRGTGHLQGRELCIRLAPT